MQSVCELLREGCIPHRLWRGCIDRPDELRIGHDVSKEADEIIAFDPGHPLRTRSDRPAEPKLEWREQVGKHAAFAAEDKTDAQRHHPHAMSLRLFRRGLPRLANAMAERALAA